MEESSSPLSFNRYEDSPYGSSYVKKRKTRLSFPSAYKILESPNHRASVETNLYRIPDGSESISKNSRELEKRWNNRFNVTFSKDNGKVYTHLREYFDSPKKFEEGIKKNSKNYSPKFIPFRERRAVSNNQRESMWSTRYTASSEWNEVKHKTLRKYFDEINK